MARERMPTREDKTTRPKQWYSIEESVFPFEGHLYGHPFTGWLWERKLEEAPNDIEKKVPTEMS